MKTLKKNSVSSVLAVYSAVLHQSLHISINLYCFYYQVIMLNNKECNFSPDSSSGG